MITYSTQADDNTAIRKNKATNDNR